LFSRRTNEDTLTTKQLGLPRPNVSIQQVSTKGGKSYIQELELKKIAIVKWLTRSVFLYTTVTFHRFHSVFHSSLLALKAPSHHNVLVNVLRSEERRVGKEWR